jgi:dihydroxyacetone kinase-like protein
MTTSADLIRIFEHVAAAIDREKDRLSALDGVIGDGDHGVTMHIGFTAVREALAGLDPATSDPTAIFNAAAKAFLNAVGASAGPLYATAFLRAGAAAKGRASLDREAMLGVIAAMAKGVQDRGKAERGDKTMIDAWLPAAEAAEREAAAGTPLAEAMARVAAAAEAGAEATKTMIAAKGRSSRLGERSLGHVDPGAASTALILSTIAAAVAA